MSDLRAREAPDLKGLRILVVEDMLLVAEAIEYQLRSWGCEVVGPVARLGQAMDLVREASIDGALLDVNLADEPCFPVAAALRARGLPFIFLTGYGSDATLPPEYRNVPRLEKPVEDDALIALIARLFRPAAVL